MNKALLLTASRFIDTHKIVLALNLIYFVLSFTAFENIFLKGFFAGIYLYIFYLHIRIYFDTMILFDLASENLTPKEFDESLCALGLAKNQCDRDIQDRCNGAVGLYKRLISASLAVILFYIVIKSAF
ncbi:MAG: hypothetical protein LUC34_07095 [Campylobacter sp.]|nr:hypothetical protein [Campylobacter sp.]